MLDLNKIEKVFCLTDIKSLNFSTLHDLPSLDPFKHLEDLTISNCELRYIPQQILNLNKLKTLKSDHNELYEINGLPKNLETVDLSYNSLSKLYIPKLHFLIELNISHNKLLALDGLSHLTSLKYLYCSCNMISSLHPLNNLEILELDISENSLKNVDFLSPLMHSLQVVCIRSNPCIHLCNFPGFFHCFLHQEGYVYYRKNLTISKSKMIKGFVPTANINLNKGGAVGRAMKELEELREKNRNLDKKVKKLEKMFTEREIEENENRVREIENMSYEDWFGSLVRYEVLKIIHAKRLQQMNYYKNMHPTKEHKLQFIKDKGRDFSTEQAKIANKMQKLLESL